MCQSQLSASWSEKTLYDDLPPPYFCWKDPRSIKLLVMERGLSPTTVSHIQAQGARLPRPPSKNPWPYLPGQTGACSNLPGIILAHLVYTFLFLGAIICYGDLMILFNSGDLSKSVTDVLDCDNVWSLHQAGKTFSTHSHKYQGTFGFFA